MLGRLLEMFKLSLNIINIDILSRSKLYIFYIIQILKQFIFLKLYKPIFNTRYLMKIF